MTGDRTTNVAKPKRAPGRGFELVGTCSAPCKRQKHEDWQHGMTGCAVGTERNHCECEAHWREIRPAVEMLHGGLGQ